MEYNISDSKNDDSPLSKDEGYSKGNIKNEGSTNQTRNERRGWWVILLWPTFTAGLLVICFSIMTLACKTIGINNTLTGLLVSMPVSIIITMRCYKSNFAHKHPALSSIAFVLLSFLFFRWAMLLFS